MSANVTLAQRKAALKYVIADVLELGDNNTFYAALTTQGYHTIPDALGIREDEWSTLTYPHQ